MAKVNSKSKKAATSSISEQQIKASAELAVHEGEKLGDVLLGIFTSQGSDLDALITETYALAKAWAALQVISKKLGVDMTELFESLQPSFQREYQELLENEE